MTATLVELLGEEVLQPNSLGDDDWEQDAWEKDDAPEWAEEEDQDDEEEEDNGYDEDEGDGE